MSMIRRLVVAGVVGLPVLSFGVGAALAAPMQDPPPTPPATHSGPPVAAQNQAGHADQSNTNNQVNVQSNHTAQSNHSLQSTNSSSSQVSHSAQHSDQSQQQQRYNSASHVEGSATEPEKSSWMLFSEQHRVMSSAQQDKDMGNGMMPR